MTPEPVPHPRVESPCIKVCELDARSVCIGCGRTVEEIAAWSSMTDEERALACRRAAQRRRQAQGRQ